MRFFEKYRPLYEQAGGGAGGTGTGTGAGGTGGTGGSEGGTGGQGAGAGTFDATAVYTKYAVPDGAKGTTWEDAYDKLHATYKPLRDQVSQFAPPKDAKSYAFTPAEKLAPFFKSADDPMMSIARETAHKLGMPDKHFGPFINDLFTTAMDKGLLPAPLNPQADIEAVGKLVAPGKSGAELKTAIETALQEASAFAPAFADAAKFSPAAKTLLTQLADEPAGIELIRFLKSKSAEFGIQVGGQGANQGGYTRADYDRDVADPRYSPRSEKYDKAWRESVDGKARTLFGQ